MKKLFIFIGLVSILVAPTFARAATGRPGGDIPSYENVPNNAQYCKDNLSMCQDTAKTHAKKHSNTGTIIVASVAVGAVFAGAMWYFFKKRPSENNPGQVKLMSF